MGSDMETGYRVYCRDGSLLRGSGGFNNRLMMRITGIIISEIIW